MKNRVFSKIKSNLSGFTLASATLALVISLIYFLAGCTTEDASTAAISTAAAGFAGMMGVFICIYVLAFVAGIFFFVVWIIALVDCAKKGENMEFPSPSENSKVLWILIIVLAGGVGSIVYYFLVMKKMPRKK